MQPHKISSLDNIHMILLDSSSIVFIFIFIFSGEFFSFQEMEQTERFVILRDFFRHFLKLKKFTLATF